MRGAEMGGLRQNHKFLRRIDLVESGNNTRWRTSFIAQTNADKHWAPDQRSEIRDIVVTARFTNPLWIFAAPRAEIPVGPAPCPTDFRAIQIATRRQECIHRRDLLRMQPGEHQRLHAALTVSHDD